MTKQILAFVFSAIAYYNGIRAVVSDVVAYELDALFPTCDDAQVVEVVGALAAAARGLSKLLKRERFRDVVVLIAIGTHTVEAQQRQSAIRHVRHVAPPYDESTNPDHGLVIVWCGEQILCLLVNALEVERSALLGTLGKDAAILPRARKGYVEGMGSDYLVVAEVGSVVGVYIFHVIAATCSGREHHETQQNQGQETLHCLKGLTGGTQEAFFGLQGALKVELLQDVVHVGLDFFVTQMADASLVAVMDVLVGMEVPSLNFQANLLVGIAKRCAGEHALVYFFHAEHQVIPVVVQNVLIYLHLAHDVGCHVQTIVQFSEGRQEDFLYDLQVAEVAAGQIVHQEQNLLGHGLNLVTLGANQLKHVWVLLVRHDAASGGTLGRQLHEAEVLRVVQAGVVGHFGQCAGYR